MPVFLKGSFRSSTALKRLRRQGLLLPISREIQILQPLVELGGLGFRRCFAGFYGAVKLKTWKAHKLVPQHLEN